MSLPRLLLLTGFAVAFPLTAPAACTTCADFQPGVSAGTVSINALTEASGIAASARNPGVLWTHNDGSSGKMFALSTNGALLATFDVNNVADVEDIAVGPGPTNGVSYLYIGDIGGSVGTNIFRPHVKILRIPEPHVDLAWAGKPRSPAFDDVKTFTLVYPDGNYDAEALMVDPLSGDLFVLTKQTGVARLYRANLNAATNRATLTLEFRQAVAFHQVSAADISADGTQIVLRREDFAQLWRRCEDESIATAFSRASQTVPLIGPPAEPNGEGIGFLRDGTGYVTISEGTNPAIYYFKSVCPVAPRFTLSLSNQSVFAGGAVQFRATATGYPEPTYSWYFNGLEIAGETNSLLVLSNVAAAQAGPYEITASNPNGDATSSAMLTVRAKPDLRITEVMPSPAANPGVPTSDWWELTSFESQSVNLSGWRFNNNGGGFADPFVITGPLTVMPGESIIFAEALTAAQFTNWWGGSNLPASLRILAYNGNGLSLGGNGDGLRLWDNVTADTNDIVARVDFGAATAGVTFNYNPVTQQFGGNSQLGVNGVIRAAAATDIGSPGRIVAPATNPVLLVRRMGDQVRIEFDALAGHRYSLEARDDLTSGGWTATGDTLQPTTSGRIFFEVAPTAPARFFRVTVD